MKEGGREGGRSEECVSVGVHVREGGREGEGERNRECVWDCAHE